MPARHSRFNRDSAGLALFAVFVVLTTLIHSPAALAALGLLALAAGGRRAPAILRRAVTTALPFTAIVALPWIFVHGLDTGGPYALRLLLRVCAIAVATFVFIARIDLLRAVRFSPSLAWMLTLVASQILVLRRAGADFSDAFESRCIERPALADRLRHASAKAAYLIAVALRQCEEVALAMRSRGFFDGAPEKPRG
jgi:cobalt/nickel transport system permease protein